MELEKEFFELEMKKYVVNIFGENYVIHTDNNQEYLNNLVENIDSRIKSIQNSKPRLSPYNVLVLCALNLIDELTQSNDRCLELTNVLEKV